MKNQNGIYPRGLEILKHPDCTVSQVAIDWDAAGSGVIPGGSPMSAAGRVANDSAAIGILRYNVYRGIHRTAPVIIGGYVDLEAAQANSGLTLSAEAKGAMPNLWFSDGGSRMGGGGLPTGGAPYQQLVTDGEGNARWEDRLAYKTGANITWNGDTTDRVNVDGELYKVSDLTPTKEELIGGKMTVPYGVVILGVDSFQEGENYLIADSVIISYADGVSCYGYTLPEKGIYFTFEGPDFYVSDLSWGEVKSLDSAFFPKNYNVVFTIDDSGETATCNCTYEELNAWILAGTPIVAHFVSPGNYCATIEYLTKASSYIILSYCDNWGSRKRYNYNSDGTITKAVD